MKQYYTDIYGRIKFYLKESIGRIKVHRKRYSHVYCRNIKGRTPFRVANYFGPAFFYSGLMNHQRKVDCGYLVVKRGIDRNNNNSEGVY